MQSQIEIQSRLHQSEFIDELEGLK